MAINLVKNPTTPVKTTEVAPIQTDPLTGLNLYEVKSIKDDCIYKFWASSYQQALQMLPMVESF